MLGGGAAFLREMFDDSVHSSEELEKQVALPLLGMTPELPRTKTVSRSSTAFRQAANHGTLDDSSNQLATSLGIVGSDL